MSTRVYVELATQQLLYEIYIYKHPNKAVKMICFW